MCVSLLEKILVGYDGKEESGRALEYSLELLDTVGATRSSEIHLIYAVEKPPGMADPIPDEVMSSFEKAGNEVLLNGARIVKKRFETPFTHLEFGSAPEKILQVADRIKPDLIVVGITKHPQSERILGTVSSLLFKTRRYPVLGVP